MTQTLGWFQNLKFYNTELTGAEKLGWFQNWWGMFAKKTLGNDVYKQTVLPIWDAL